MEGGEGESRSGGSGRRSLSVVGRGQSRTRRAGDGTHLRHNTSMEAPSIGRSACEKAGATSSRKMILKRCRGRHAANKRSARLFSHPVLKLTERKRILHPIQRRLRDPNSRSVLQASSAPSHAAQRPKRRTSQANRNPTTSTSQGPAAQSLATSETSLAPSHPVGSSKSSNFCTGFRRLWNLVSNVAYKGCTAGMLSVRSVSVEEGRVAVPASGAGWERTERSRWQSPGVPRLRRRKVRRREADGARRPREKALMREVEEKSSMRSWFAATGVSREDEGG